MQRCAGLTFLDYTVYATSRVQSNISMHQYECILVHADSSLHKDHFWAAFLVSGSFLSKEDKSSASLSAKCMQTVKDVMTLQYMSEGCGIHQHF